MGKIGLKWSHIIACLYAPPIPLSEWKWSYILVYAFSGLKKGSLTFEALTSATNIRLSNSTRISCSFVPRSSQTCEWNIGVSPNMLFRYLKNMFSTISALVFLYLSAKALWVSSKISVI